ncbi:hypothetical protein EAE96_006622 [Botrytis aclada]|nr:hypothetical protein EAE96_006622 [Botrytis aclada]
MNILQNKRKDGNSATPSIATKSANSSKLNVTSTNHSSTTQVANPAFVKGGSGSESDKHGNHKSHGISTNSSSTAVGSSSNSAKEGKAGSGSGSGKKSHHEKENHGSGASSSQASTTSTRPELKRSSGSLLSTISARAKIVAEERNKDKELEKRHKALEGEKHSNYTYIKKYNAAELEQSRYQREKYILEDLEKDPRVTMDEKEEQKEIVKLKRQIRNQADAAREKLFKEDEIIAGKQLGILIEMSESNSYRAKVVKGMKKEDKEYQKWVIKQDEKKKRAIEAARVAEEEKIANEMKMKK